MPEIILEEEKCNKANNKKNEDKKIKKKNYKQ
jgi:hypothetical protein